MKLTNRRAGRPVSLALCLLSAVLITACGGGGAEEAATTETADAALKNQKNNSTQGATTTTTTTTSTAPITTITTPTTTTPTTFSLDLSWVAPQANADGTALNDLAGYRILVGTSSGSYSKIITIDNPSTVNHSIPNLPAATYYVVVKAVDTSNNESAPSSELVKVLQ